MNSDKPGSAASSDATSKRRLPPDTTESDFLNDQAAKARDAMRQALHDMADSLVSSADPRGWTREYPLISLGAAAALGFLMASAITPSREETFRERLRSLFPERPAAPPEQERREPTDQKNQSPIWAVAGPILDFLKPAVASAVASAVTFKTQEGGPGDDQSGSSSS